MHLPSAVTSNIQPDRGRQLARGAFLRRDWAEEVFEYEAAVLVGDSGLEVLRHVLETRVAAHDAG